MFTVTFDCELSGKSKTRTPLSNWYSLMPSTVATFLGLDTSAAKQMLKLSINITGTANSGSRRMPAGRGNTRFFISRDSCADWPVSSSFWRRALHLQHAGAEAYTFARQL